MELKRRGHRVTVITSFPVESLMAEDNGKNLKEFNREDGIDVIRIKTLPQFKVNFFIRGFSQLILPYLFSFKVKKYLKGEVDTVIIYSPPLPLALVGKKVKKLYGAKFILNLQDIFPQNAIDLNILRNPFLIRLFEIIESKVYKNADIITVHSSGNKEFLVREKGIRENKIHIVHNWIDVGYYLKARGKGFYREKFGLKDKFVFLFAGIIGPSQGLELLIEIANRIKNFPDICFLIVGEGKEKSRLQNMAENYSLDNVIFRPMISKEDYATLLKEVDVGIVCLSNKNKTPVVPGKLLGYMAASLPVVGFLNKESDAHEIIKRACCGYSAVSDDPVEATDIILRIYNEQDKLKLYGENGFNYVSNNFSKDICIDKLENLFNPLKTSTL